MRQIASRNGHFRWTWRFDLTESRKDKARLILRPLIRKGSSSPWFLSRLEAGVEFQNWSALREQLAATLVLSCTHCFRLDLWTSTSGRFHALAFVFLTSMNFRERCCLFEVFRMNFDPMLCVNIQKNLSQAIRAARTAPRCSNLLPRRQRNAITAPNSSENSPRMNNRQKKLDQAE